MYPALTVLQALGSNQVDVLWVGGQNGMEAELVTRQNIPFTGIPAAGVHGVGLRSLPGNLWQLFRGLLASYRILNEFKPDVLLFTGGYVAVPMALAGIKYESLLYVPDIEPGLALKVLARFSDYIALTSDESRQFFSKRTPMVKTGYPTRPDLVQWNRENSRQLLGLTNDLPVLLVFGGSKGARSINRAITANLTEILSFAQVVHISGKLDWEEIQKAKNNLPTALSQHYHAYPYLHEEMGAALASADLVVSRAGASTLGEFPLFGLPAILVPYPYAWRYQKVNADFLVKNEAAVFMEDANMGRQLLPTLRTILSDPERLAKMKQSMLSLAQPQAAERIADLLRELAARSRQKGKAVS